MNMNKSVKIIETILFIEKDPLSIEDLIQLTNLNYDIVEKSLEELEELYSTSDHGIHLENDNGHYVFAPKKELYEELRTVYGKKVDKRLSKAALETLSIIAYSQPITRKQIEKIRGVSSDAVVRILREREYIKVVGRQSDIGHAPLYGTSRKFLYEFKLKSISHLPKLDDIDSLRFEKEGEIS